MTEPTAGYSLNPTIGISGGLVHTTVPTSRVVVTPDGTQSVALQNAYPLPAGAVAANIDYPVTKLGLLMVTPGIQGGLTRWGKYESLFGSVYGRFNIDFGHDYFSTQHGVDLAWNVSCQPWRRIGIQTMGGARIEPSSGYSQVFILGGLTVRLGYVDHTSPANLATGVGAFGQVQEKHRELEQLFEKMGEHLKQFYNLPTADTSNKLHALGQYVEWITTWETPAEFEKPALGDIFRYIKSARALANKAIPSPHPYKDAEMAKINRFMTEFNAKMAQPALDIMFFMQNSIFDDILNNARAASIEAGNKNVVGVKDRCVQHSMNLDGLIQLYVRISPLMNREQLLKVGVLPSYMKCLQIGSMCPSGAEISLTIPNLEEQLRRITNKPSATCRITTTNGNAKGASQ